MSFVCFMVKSGRASIASVVLGLLVFLCPSLVARVEIPGRLSDDAFWRLSAGASEPGGYFRSQDITNLTSNELGFQQVIPDLVRRTRPGGVYLGVGPEQNFTYMAALRPKMAFIFDVRRGNLDLQLMYKALFELSVDRADFVAMLFARPRPRTLNASSSAGELFRAVAEGAPSDPLYRRHLAAIERQLVGVHRLPLGRSDLTGIRTIYQAFYVSGFAVRPYPTYADLMLATDAGGVNHSYLATEESFAFVKDLQARNLVVPVVGDFAGPKAIRTVGAWLKARDATVGGFYLSNVEQYLYQQGRWDAFCRNVATLPLDSSSTFIRSASGGVFGRRGGFISSLGAINEDVQWCRAS